ncbi:hypothetical protein IKJ53_07245, partial [bacterium]|nr:hypothetical protein [bacterium]
MSSVNYSPTFSGLKNNPPKTQKYKYNDALQTNAGYFAGSAITGVLGLGALPIADKMAKMNHKISPDKAAELFEHAKTALKNSGLGDKVSLETLKNVKEINKIIKLLLISVFFFLSSLLASTKYLNILISNS